MTHRPLLVTDAVDKGGEAMGLLKAATIARAYVRVSLRQFGERKGTGPARTVTAVNRSPSVRSRWSLGTIEAELVEQPALIASPPPHHRAASAVD